MPPGSAGDERLQRDAQAREPFRDILIADVQRRHEAQHIRPGLQQQQSRARSVVEKAVRASSVLYARIDSHSNGSDAPDLTLTAYFFDPGHAAIG